LPQNAALTALVGKLQDAVVAVDLAAVKQQLQGSRDALAAPGAVGPDGQTPIWTCMNHRAGWEITLGESKEVRPEPACSRLARACEISVGLTTLRVAAAQGKKAPKLAVLRALLEAGCDQVVGYE
jgi:hypothetical protein